MGKNPHVNAVLERLHQVIGRMLCTAKIDMAESVTPDDDIDVFLDNVAWAICSTYHTILKASPGTAEIGQDMLFAVPFLADWHKVEEHRQSPTDPSNQ
jgi:hypothetical protein